MNVKYTLTAEVDDTIVFESSYADTESVQEELRKAEFQVKIYIQQEEGND